MAKPPSASPPALRRDSPAASGSRSRIEEDCRPSPRRAPRLAARPSPAPGRGPPPSGGKDLAIFWAGPERSRPAQAPGVALGGQS